MKRKSGVVDGVDGNVEDNQSKVLSVGVLHAIVPIEGSTQVAAEQSEEAALLPRLSPQDVGPRSGCGYFRCDKTLTFAFSGDANSTIQHSPGALGTSYLIATFIPNCFAGHQLYLKRPFPSFCLRSMPAKAIRNVDL